MHTGYDAMIKSLGGPTKKIFDHLISNGFDRERTQATYVVQVNPPNGRVKIGKANVPLLRWVEIASNWPELYPLRIITIIRGGAEKERELQREFSRFLVYSEWFDYTPLFEELSSVRSFEELSEWLSKRAA